MNTYDDYDSPWKEILEHYFEEFMLFFFPEAHADIDWSLGYESLDIELQKIARDAELGKRLADKLMKVYRHSGEPLIVLIHLEIQGQYERAFPGRMYVYNYRIFDKYGYPVVSLAILGDDDPNWRPTAYRMDLWGCRTGIEFPVIKLHDYQSRESELEADTNPFSVVVLAHLQTRLTRHDPQARLTQKMRLVRLLYERGYQRQQILELFRFIDWLLRLPDELAQRFDEQLKTYEATMSTPYITSIERHGIEKGRQEGLKQGIEQGIEQGIARRLIAEKQMLARQAQLRYGSNTASVLAALLEHTPDTDQLAQVAEWIISVESEQAFLTQVRELLGEH